MGGKLKGILKDNVFLLQYLGCVTAVVYIIGYLFISGVNSGFCGENILAVYSYNRVNVLSKTYIATGIRFVVRYSIHIILAIIIGRF